MTDKYHDRLRKSKADYEAGQHRLGHTCGTQFARVKASYGELLKLIHQDYATMQKIAAALQLGEWQLHEVAEGAAGPDYVAGFLAGCRKVFDDVFGRDAQYQPPETD